MAVLRCENSDIYTFPKAVNQLIAPLEVGHFGLSKTVTRLLAQPLDAEGKEAIYQFVPKQMDEYCRSKGLSPTRAFTVCADASLAIKNLANDSAIPHANEHDAVHFVFAGATILYLNLSPEQFAIILQPGDWMYIPGQVTHWFKMTSDFFMTIASYHAIEANEFDQQKNYYPDLIVRQIF